VPHGVHPAVQAVDPSVRHPGPDRLSVQAALGQFGYRQDPPLATSSL
jgi:hypothetical protein